MFFFSFCCSKNREEDAISIAGLEQKQKTINRILLEFVSEEMKIGLKNISCMDMVENVLIASNVGEIARKDLIEIFKSIDMVNQTSIKNFMVHEFFFTDNTKLKYNLNKVAIFVILYSGGAENEKANFLYTLLENPKTSGINNHSHNLI